MNATVDFYTGQSKNAPAEMEEVRSLLAANGHVVEPAMVREAERVLAIAKRNRAHVSSADSSAIHVL